ncbi:glycosyl hydrolase [Aurantiacibacter xanthus]|uniref:Glycosyl hydrolase n=1 Tax=Aurantiacibacter xanthus TaxID=1784712 RepID=A0A3A1P3W0_9SPHN|nr:glycoside hydrolase family 3 C-terminal domain-containing protein [Aurantiacibacter xanthus]RIV80102.1 glycosyl hydrolase [Aurantiacibacter xanthus]
MTAYRWIGAALLAGAATVSLTPALGQQAAPVVQAAQDRAWMNTDLPSEARVDLLIEQMTLDEKITLMMGYFGTAFPPRGFTPPAEAREGSAGYVPGIPRLGIPPQWQTDAAIGVATQGFARNKRERTALPSNLAVAASWDPELAFAGGQMIGAEARASGFNVMLAGGVNLEREPRNGRNFEYGGEDPLLAGTIVGSATAGVQSNQIIATVKHYALNDQETDRNAGNVIIDHDAARMSDLLAFKIAIEKSNAGSVMCSYNRVDGDFSCENSWLLTDVLRNDWQWPGYVMSDWGATHSTAKALKAGQDQQSGYPFDQEEYFGAKLAEALAAGEVSEELVDRSVSRILYAMVEHGLFDHPVTGAPPDLEAEMLASHAEVTRRAAADSIVLLKNDHGVLPLASSARRIAVIGGHADRGVLAGGGSSLVYPVGGNAVPEAEPRMWPGPKMFYPFSPLEALRTRYPNAEIVFVTGDDQAAAARAAQTADIAIVFATQWAAESIDIPLTLPDNQDALIQRVAEANDNTVVVLETGGVVLTPWRNDVAAILAAWFPGTQGGQAIADVISGAVNPSGHLPVSFIESLDQLPHPQEPQHGDVHYTEGATVGYKWLDANGHAPAFPFGHGLSYTQFSLSDLSANAAGSAVTLRFEVANTGSVAGKEVAQIYVSGPGLEAPRRLAGFKKVELEPGESSEVAILVDPRMMATFSKAAGGWNIAEGTYTFHLAHSSREFAGSVEVAMPAMTVPTNRF